MFGRLVAGLCAVAVSGALLAGCGSAGSSAAGSESCPGDGAVRMGAQPAFASPDRQAAYDELASVLSKKIGCHVTATVTSSYAAETEAISHDKLEFAEFPPFGYVLAADRAGLQVLASSGGPDGRIVGAIAGIAVKANSPFHSLTDLRGHSIAFSAPTATSGYLLPAYGLTEAGVDPKTDVRAVFGGNHTAAFAALKAGKVDAAEVNNIQLARAKKAGQWKPGEYRMLWQSAPSPADPIVVRKELPDDFKNRLRAALLQTKFSELSPAAQKVFGVLGATQFVPATSSDYDSVRKVVKALGITPGQIHP